MKAKRRAHSELIDNFQKKAQEYEKESQLHIVPEGVSI